MPSRTPCRPDTQATPIQTMFLEPRPQILSLNDIKADQFQVLNGSLPPVYSPTGGPYYMECKTLEPRGLVGIKLGLAFWADYMCSPSLSQQGMDKIRKRRGAPSSLSSSASGPTDVRDIYRSRLETFSLLFVFFFPFKSQEFCFIQFCFCFVLFCFILRNSKGKKGLRVQMPIIKGMLQFNPAVTQKLLNFSLAGEVLENKICMIKWHPKTLNSQI